MSLPRPGRPTNTWRACETVTREDLDLHSSAATAPYVGTADVAQRDEDRRRQPRRGLSLLENVELVGPGVVPADQWEPDETTTGPSESRTFMYGAIARKQ